MDEWATLFAGLVTAFGPAGAVALLLALVVGFFYRRDLLRRLGHSQTDLSRMLAAVEANAAANTTIARALDQMGTAFAEHEQRHQQALDAAGPKLEHAINAGFHAVLLELRLANRRGEA